MSEETKTISIARGLVELKSLAGRIERAGSLPVIGVIVGKGEAAKPADASLLSVDAAKKQYESNFNSINDLIKRREAVKRAIVKANASTTVTIAGVTYTLAEAIEMKKFVSVRKSFIQRLSLQMRQAASSHGQIMTALNTRIDTYRNGRTATDSAEVTAASITDMRNSGEPTIIAPVDMAAFITSELASIEVFEQEVDVALNETNAATQIAVE